MVLNSGEAQRLLLDKNVPGQDLALSSDKYAGPLKNISQFTDVSGPVVPKQRLKRLCAQAYPRAELRQKCLGELLDIFKALTQGRQLNWKNRETIIQILAKQVLLDAALQIGVCRRYHPNVHLQVVIAADSLHFALFEKAQHFALQRQRHITNLVKEQRPHMRRMDSANTRLHSASERTFHIAKQFGFKKRLRDGCAIDHDKRLCLAQAYEMDRLRNQILTSAALPSH
jgi:hypothetical protein